MGTAISTLTLRGFKSIRELEDFPLRNLNVLIGANGAGKSNFVDFFRMLRAFAGESFQQFVNDQGGGDQLLFMGPKVTKSITASLEFGVNIYGFELTPTAAGTLQVSQEVVKFTGGAGKGDFETLSFGTMEPALKQSRNDRSKWTETLGVAHDVYDSVANWTVYHFHDTSPLAPMRRDQSLRDWERFRPDASNIAAFLHRLKETREGSYELIRDTVRLIAPFFKDFLLRPQARGGLEQVRLEWQQKGSDLPFQPSQLSDGTIRFICLATALQQPDLPATIVIDEPELGLHPYAISVLAGLIQSAAARTQVIVSTQSPTLLDYFEPDDIIVVSRRHSRSTFERLDESQLTEWLKEYTVGELWQKDIVHGGPTHD